MPEVDTRFALLLDAIDGIGPVKYQKIIEHFADLSSFAAGVTKDILNECGLTDKQAAAVANGANNDKIDAAIEKAASENIKIICLGQNDYPEQLAQIYSPPIIVYLKGNSSLLSRPAIAIVGSRTPTAYGREMSAKIAGGLASHGLVIISGLAWGIDACAHQAALDAGGLTGAIFGCGIDIIYPSEHRELASKISERGFLLSEFSFGTIPDKFNFPRRNRIISGLSRAVVVVEAAEKSGALVTADLAAEQGKDVFAVPGQVDNPKSQGALNLLKQGAAIATSADDILEALGWEVKAEAEKAVAIDLEPEEQKICDVVGMGPAHFDELVRRLGFTPSKVSSILLKLEMAGVIVRRPGNYVARI